MPHQLLTAQVLLLIRHVRLLRPVCYLFNAFQCISVNMFCSLFWVGFRGSTRAKAPSADTCRTFLFGLEGKRWGNIPDHMLRMVPASSRGQQKRGRGKPCCTSRKSLVQCWMQPSVFKLDCVFAFVFLPCRVSWLQSVYIPH